MKHYVRGMLVAALLSSTASISVSETFQIELAAGQAFESSGDYDEARVYDVALGYDFDQLAVRAGYLDVAELKLSGSESVGVDVDAFYVGLAKVLKFQVIDLELGGGLARYESEANFHSADIGKEDDVTPYVEINLIKPFEKSRVSIQVGWMGIHDVSGSDLSVLQAGFRLSF